MYPLEVLRVIYIRIRPDPIRSDPMLVCRVSRRPALPVPRGARAGGLEGAVDHLCALRDDISPPAAFADDARHRSCERSFGASSGIELSIWTIPGCGSTTGAQPPCVEAQFGVRPSDRRPRSCLRIDRTRVSRALLDGADLEHTESGSTYVSRMVCSMIFLVVLAVGLILTTTLAGFGTFVLFGGTSKNRASESLVISTRPGYCARTKLSWSLTGEIWLVVMICFR